MFLSEWREFLSVPYLAGKRNLMTASVSMLLKSRASLTCFRACFLPGQAKDLSAPRYVDKNSGFSVIWMINFVLFCKFACRWSCVIMSRHWYPSLFYSGVFITVGCVQKSVKTNTSNFCRKPLRLCLSGKACLVRAGRSGDPIPVGTIFFSPRPHPASSKMGISPLSRG